jgi:hypothetical protein
MTRTARPFGKLKPAASRAVLEEMTWILLGVAELNDDLNCISALIAARFKPNEIFDFLDSARDLARAALLDEAELWSRLQNTG